MIFYVLLNMKLKKFVKKYPNQCTIDIREYSLRHGNISRLPKNMGYYLKSTKFFHCDYNRVQKLPNSIFQLIDLKSLFVGHNLIYKLSDHIHFLQNLQELSISRNKLENFPYSIGKLPHLCRLWIYDNPFRSLPISISRLQLDDYWTRGILCNKKLPKIRKISINWLDFI